MSAYSSDDVRDHVRRRQDDRIGGVATALVVGAILAFWLLKTIVQKVAVAVLLGLLAFAVWSQRTALVDCADKVEASYVRVGTSVTLDDTECSFFGMSVTISDPRTE